MKARVKATGEIVEVVYNGFYYESIKDERVFDKSELEIMSQTKDPDYWTKLEHQYVGMAMHSILQTMPRVSDPDKYMKAAIDLSAKIAHALVEKLKMKQE